MNIVEAMQTPALYGDTFLGDSWEAWRAILSGAFNLPMTDTQKEHFNALAGGREAPKKRVRELFVISGRRCSKSHTTAATAIYLATLGFEIEGLKDRLSVGEKPVISLLAVDRSQAKVIFNYVRGMLEASPVFSAMIHKQYAESIELSNGVNIEVGTSNYRAIRGRSLVACIFDEACFFRDSETSESNDLELYRAALPSLSTTNGMLIAVSSPYAKRGLMYSKYEKHYGQDNDDILVIRAASLDLNPTLDPKIIEQAMIDDPESAQAEWLGNFREGLSSYVDRAVVEGCVRKRPLIIPPQDKRQYVGFVDPSGGGQSSRADRFTLAIAYREADKVIVCGIWGRRGAPDEITKEYAGILKAYGLHEVFGDRYAGAYPAQEFQRHGINLKYTPLNRSQLYLEALPVMQTGRCELPPDDILIGELCSLERKAGRLSDIVDHAVGGHDDLANSAAGVIYHSGIAHKTYPKVTIKFLY